MKFGVLTNMTKRRIWAVLIGVSGLIAGISTLLSYYIPISSLGRAELIAIIIVENTIIGISCFVIAAVLTKSVIRRNNEHHFINLPSLAFAACFFYGGGTMIMEVITIWYRFWWLAIIIRLVVAIVTVAVAIGTFKNSKYLTELPDVAQLLSTIEKLQNRVGVLKSTNPYVDEDGFTSGEKLDLEILTTLRRVSEFLQSVESPSQHNSSEENTGNY